MPSEEKKESSEKERIKPVIEELVDERPHYEKTNSDSESEPEEVPLETSEIPDKSEVIMVPPPATTKKRLSFLPIMITLMVALLVGSLIGGVVVYTNGISKLASPSPSPSSGSPTPSAIQTPIVSASPSPTPNYVNFKINILNGSGKIGEANKVKALIEKAGFKVSTTGNAATFDFKDTVIQSKKAIPQEAIDKLTAAISSSYETEVGKVLVDSGAYDITITVGSE